MKFLFSIILACLFICGNSQITGTYLNPIINGQTLHTYIGGKFLKSKKSFDSTSINGTGGMAWVKFRIGEDSRLYDLAFNAEMNIALQEFITAALDSLNGHWPVKKRKGKRVKSEYLVLPVYYVFLKDGKADEIYLNPLKLIRFFNAGTSAEPITFFPEITLHRG